MDLSACSENELLELFRLILSLPGEITKSQHSELFQINEEMKHAEEKRSQSAGRSVVTTSR
jgi:hypothetical protein